jgi:hypothetical protein
VTRDRWSGSPLLVPSVSAVVLAVAVAACSVTDPLLRPGWRQLIVSVENESARPAVILVAEDGPTGMGKTVGTVEPGVVPPGATIDVTLGLPPEPNWGIFVNPNPKFGPVVASIDMPPGASGRVPITLNVSSSGAAGATLQGNPPGWFGN